LFLVAEYIAQALMRKGLVSSPLEIYVVASKEFLSDLQFLVIVLNGL
jgi:hypothetical protein